MTHNENGNGSAADNHSGPIDASEEALDQYLTDLYNQGRDLFTRHLPLEAGLNAVIGTTDDSDAKDGRENWEPLRFLSNPPDSEGWFKAELSEGTAACVEVRFASQGVQVRDSKNRRGPTLTFRGKGWDGFIGQSKVDLEP